MLQNLLEFPEEWRLLQHWFTILINTHGFGSMSGCDGQVSTYICTIQRQFSPGLYLSHIYSPVKPYVKEENNAFFNPQHSSETDNCSISRATQYEACFPLISWLSWISHTNTCLCICKLKRTSLFVCWTRRDSKLLSILRRSDYMWLNIFTLHLPHNYAKTENTSPMNPPLVLNV